MSADPVRLAVLDILVQVGEGRPLDPLLDELRAASSRLDYDATLDILNHTVKEYSPSTDVDDLVWAQKIGLTQKSNTQTVVEFPTRDT